MSFQKGDRVVATKDIGGIFREPVPKGSKRVVVKPGGFFGGPTRVLFTIESVFGRRRQVEIDVEPG